MGCVDGLTRSLESRFGHHGDFLWGRMKGESDTGRMCKEEYGGGREGCCRPDHGAVHTSRGVVVFDGRRLWLVGSL